jgi:pyridoxamine 5'-phosphate oxidase
MSDYESLKTLGIRREELAADPIAEFAKWLETAVAADLAYPNTMILSTVGADGMPSGRAVLLKDVDAEGFVFYTNYGSAKAEELDARRAAALTFCWPSLGMQVRVRGGVEKVTAEESDDYFATRPRESQTGAWASQQSCELRNRAELERRRDEVTGRFAGEEIPRPPFWGGYRVTPETIEFWKGREGRLHDRFEYRREENGAWAIVRLSP